MPATYTTTSGEILALDLATPEEADYFGRVQIAAADPEVDLNGLVDLVYAEGNPILEPSPFPGRGLVTKAVLARPVYHAMQDLLYRKTVARQLGEEPDAAFTVPTAEAARRLGISEVSVRQAMREGRLSARKLKGRLYTTNAAVDAYEVGARGPRSEARVRRSEAPPLQVAWGSMRGRSLSIRPEQGKQVEGVTKEGGPDDLFIRRGQLDGWTSLEVRSTLKGEGEGDSSFRYWRLVPETDPDAPEQSIGLEPFEVRGRFRVEQSAWGRRAAELWRAGKGRG